MPGQQDNPKFTPKANENEEQRDQSGAGTDTKQDRERMTDGGRNQGRPQDDRDPNSPTRSTQPQRPSQTQATGQDNQQDKAEGGDNDRDPQRQMERDMENGSLRSGQGQGNKPSQQPRQI